MANGVAQSVGQWTAAQLYAVAGKVYRDAKAAKAAMLDNRSRVAALFRRVEQIPDQRARESATADARKISAQLARQFLDYQRFTQTWNGVMQRVGSFFRSIGATPVELELNGLGAAPAIVPVAVAAGVAAAAAFIVGMVNTNRAVGTAISTLDRAYSDFMDGKISFEQYREIGRTVGQTAEAASRAAGRGTIQGTLEAAMPLVLLIAAVLILPQLLPMMRRALPRGAS